MNTTKIPYGTHHWPLVMGCSHGADICAVSADCWARDMSKRFHKDFAPALHPERLHDRMPRKSSRILVSFTGDMFGEWWQGNEMWGKIVRVVQSTAVVYPDHVFVFLTKNPAAYRLFNPWPSNVWLGTSITGAEPREVQQARLDALRRAESTGVLWVSYEPMLGPLLVDNLDGINWLVLGPHNKGKVKPERAWLDAAWAMASIRPHFVAIWEKDELQTYQPALWNPVQELPR